MSGPAPAEPAPTQPAAAFNRLQAAAFLRRWLARRGAGTADGSRPAVPAGAPLPPRAWRHYRHFAWVVHEQRILVLVLGFLSGGCLLAWSAAWSLGKKPAVVIRAGPSLKAAAAAQSGSSEVSYDQLAFFLHGCLPLLHSTDDAGHPLLPLAQGVVAPDVYRDAEARLDSSAADILANRMTQTLTLTGVSDVVSDPRSGRAAAYVRGYLTVTLRRAEARFFPWRGRVLLAVNSAGRLNPYPFYLLACEERTGPRALAWDMEREGRNSPPP